MAEKNYLLKVKLQYSNPPIWRRFVVPDSITLDRLHDVIQIVMGWEDSHLHEFTIGKKQYTEEPDPEFMDGVLEEGAYQLGDLIKRKGQKFEYTYDFGDNWQHLLILENSNFTDETISEIICVDGARACPPEDVGGVPGYAYCCEALKDPDHEEHEDFKEWVGNDFDSETFDLNATNMELLKYERWSRSRPIP